MGNTGKNLVHPAFESKRNSSGKANKKEDAAFPYLVRVFHDCRRPSAGKMAISGNARLLRERRNAPAWKPEGLRECSGVKAGGPDVSDFCEGPFAGIGASAALLVFNAVSEMGFFKKAVHV